MNTADFDSRVVVTSSSTVADVPAMMHAISTLRPLVEEMELCHSSLQALAHQSQLLAAQGVWNLGYGRAHIVQAQDTLFKSEHDLRLFTQRLGTSALCYTAAEGDAAAFAELRAWLYPSALSYLEAFSVGGSTLLHPLSDGRRDPQRPWRQAWRSGRLRDLLPAPFQHAAVSVAVYGAIFATNSGSDPTDSWAMQFHVEELSRSLMRSTHWFHQSEAHAGQVWGANATHATPEAAAVAGGPSWDGAASSLVLKTVSSLDDQSLNPRMQPSPPSVADSYGHYSFREALTRPG